MIETLDSRLSGMVRDDVEVSSVVERLRSFRALVLDADGVWWDGRETRIETTVMKTRDLRDGQGLSFLRALGVRVLFATAEKAGPLATVVEKLNALPSVASGKWAPVSMLDGLSGGKVDAIERWFTTSSPWASGTTAISKIVYVEDLSWPDVVYVGDDRVDLEAMRKTGLAVCPGDAQRCARKLAHVVLTRPGGGGAVRELAELVLDARGVDEADLPAQ